MKFELIDRDLTWIRIDQQTRLQFGDTELMIECPFRLRMGGVDHGLDPADRAGLGPLLTLYPDSVESLTMEPGGTLVAQFTSGAVLTVPPDDRYEAWSIGGFVCAPGGFSSKG